MSCSSSRKYSARQETGAFPAPKTPKSLVAAVPPSLRNAPVYSYIVTTFRTDPAGTLTQTGNSPNFAGGRITLCACKHKDRATMHLSRDPNDPWKGVWVAGFTSKTEDPSRALAYLMHVESSFPNQNSLWTHLPASCRRDKCVSHDPLGDLFEPRASATKTPHAPSSYHPPMSGHRHEDCWQYDIQEWGAKHRPHRLLLGAKDLSFRWTKVAMVARPQGVMGATAHHKVFDTLSDFVDALIIP
jgi:hypothetical protein